MIIITLAGVICGGFTIYAIKILLRRTTMKSQCITSIKLPYKKFLDFYELNPSKWRIEHDACVYKTDIADYSIYFSLPDTCKYLSFARRVTSHRQYIDENDGTCKFLKEIQKDIEKHRSENVHMQIDGFHKIKDEQNRHITYMHIIQL